MLIFVAGCVLVVGITSLNDEVSLKSGLVLVVGRIFIKEVEAKTAEEEEEEDPKNRS